MVNVHDHGTAFAVCTGLRFCKTPEGGLTMCAFAASGDKTTRMTFVAKDSASATVNSLRKNISSLGGPKFGPLGSLVSGFASMGLASIGMAGGIGLVTGVLGDSAKAAIEDEISVAKLTQSLKDNVPAWNGSTTAVEDAIKVGERYAFSAVDQRDALAQLLTRTHDVDEATALLSTSEDVARLKGMDLATASALIGKVYSGTYTAAIKAGFAIDKHATATQALATIQTAAAGQMQAYADTTQGAMDVAATAWHEAEVKIGGAIAPIVKELAQLVTGTSDAAGTAGVLEAKWEQMAQTGQGVAGSIAAIGKGDQSWLGLLAITEHVDDAMSLLGNHYKSWANSLQSYGDMVGLTGDALDHFVSVAAGGGASYDTIRQSLMQMVQAQHAAEAGFGLLGTTTASTTDSMSADFDALGLTADRIKDIIAGIPPSIADELKSGRSAVQAASDNLAWAIKHPQAEAHRMVTLEAQLTAKDLLKNLQSKNPEIRAAAVHKRDIIETELKKLRDNAFVFGVETATNLLAGFNGGIGGGGYWGDPPAAPRHKQKKTHTWLDNGAGNSGGAPATAGGSAPNGDIVINVDGESLFRIMNKRMGRQFGYTTGGTSRN